jgi:putative PIN family toxin of toxin-antitoxin system
MKVVLDANVILAALITEGLCHALLEQCMNDHRMCVSDDLKNEVFGKLEKKFHASSKLTTQARTWLEDIADSYVPAFVSAESCRDPKDAHILGLAIAAGADCIVTGDQDLLVLKKHQSIPILSPREFYMFLQKKHSR